jgi:hypothetical protein
MTRIISAIWRPLYSFIEIRRHTHLGVEP